MKNKFTQLNFPPRAGTLFNGVKIYENERYGLDRLYLSDYWRSQLGFDWRF